MLWDWTYGFSSLSEKTRRSNRLQMSLQRQHFLLSYLKTLSFGPPGFEPATSRSADGHSPRWANQAVVVAFYWHVFQNILLPLRRQSHHFSRVSLSWASLSLSASGKRKGSEDVKRLKSKSRTRTWSRTHSQIAGYFYTGGDYTAFFLPSTLTCVNTN